MESSEKKQFVHLRSRAFARYLLSYIAIVLILLAVLSIMTMRHLSMNMKKEEIRIAESKLNILAEDLDTQMGAMQRMVIEIAALPEFRLSVSEANKYQEMELLNRLGSYSREVGICSEYFLKYAKKDTLFTSAKRVSFSDVYLSGLLGKEEVYSDLKLLLEEMSSKPESPFVFYKKNDVMLFLYSLKEYAYSKVGLDGVLCFAVKEENLRARFEKLAGNMDGRFVLYYQDMCLMEEAGEQDDIVLEVSSASGDVELIYYMGDTSVFTWKNVFSVKEQFFLIAMIALVILVGFVLAYLNHLPLRKIIDKYGGTVEGSLNVDWKSIDLIIEKLLRGKEKDSELFLQQYQMLKEQTIRNIALGGYNSRTQKYLTLLNIELSGQFYGIIKCQFACENQMAVYEKLVNDVEALSGEGEILYMYWDEGPRILVAVEERYQLEEVEELLQALFDALEVEGTTQLVRMSNDLTQIHSGKLKKEALLKENRLKEQKEDSERDIDAKGKQSVIGIKVVEYIETHCTDYELSLDLLGEKFQLTTNYLSRIVKQITGTSYKEFVTGLRMEEAKKMLRNEEISIADVCQKTGYNNVSHFIKIFQKYTDMTPAKYREESKLEKDNG